jgi:glutathione S-transferase
MLKLFYVPGSCARASHIALREASADFELRLVDFGAEEQRTAAYRDINPKGRVPVLETDRGALTETPAILAYIAQSYPDAALAPLNDAFEFARMQAFNNYLCATVHVAHAHGRRPERWADDADAQAELRSKASGRVAECFELIENRFFTGPWVLGESYCVADAYLFTLTQWLRVNQIDSADFPQVHAHHNRMFERPAVREALAAEKLG